VVEGWLLVSPDDEAPVLLLIAPTSGPPVFEFEGMSVVMRYIYKLQSFFLIGTWHGYFGHLSRNCEAKPER